MREIYDPFRLLNGREVPALTNPTVGIVIEAEIRSGQPCIDGTRPVHYRRKAHSGRTGCPSHRSPLPRCDVDRSERRDGFCEAGRRGLVKVLIDDDVAEPFVAMLVHLLPTHEIISVRGCGWSGKEDVPLYADAVRCGFDVTLSANHRQLLIPEEVTAIRKSRMHVIHYEQADAIPRYGAHGWRIARGHRACHRRA